MVLAFTSNLIICHFDPFAIGIVFTSALSILSTVIRARVKDRLLSKKFGKEWENYTDKVGFLFPKLKSKHKN